jgi:hypothetical protein
MPPKSAVEEKEMMRSGTQRVDPEIQFRCDSKGLSLITRIVTMFELS